MHKSQKLDKTAWNEIIIVSQLHLSCDILFRVGGLGLLVYALVGEDSAQL